ncbi:MAG TPA: hypothetical protein VFN22_02085 [Gemmatimonadales bacterium]|nr:hypothetical protein [Gemmatimonadales bacterium]
MITRGTTLLVCLAAIVSPPRLAAQSMRTYAASRPVTDTGIPLRASLDFGAGRVVVRAGDPAVLYATTMEYDAERYTPVQRYDPRTGILHLGLASIGRGGLRVTSREHLQQAARFEFAPGVPLNLEANLGASEAHLDLGGLAVHDVTVRAGASRSAIDVTKPSGVRCERARFISGASELQVRQLANLGCREVRIEGGAGSTTIDFSGAWSADTRVTATLTVGTLTLRIPRSVGVHLDATGRFLSRLTFDGLTRSGDSWQSANFAGAEHHITIDLTTNVADVTVEWID